MFLWILLLPILGDAKFESNFTVTIGYDEVVVTTSTAEYQAQFSINFWVGKELVYNPILQELMNLDNSEFTFETTDDGRYGELKYDLKKINIDLVKIQDLNDSLSLQTYIFFVLLMLTISCTILDYAF